MTLSRFRARHGVSVLGPGDLPDFLALTGRDPVVNAFAEYRARSTNLEPRLLAGEIWGRYDAGRLVAACHVGANLVPVECTPDDARAFAERALTRPRSVITIVGLQEQVWPTTTPAPSLRMETHDSADALLVDATARSRGKVHHDGRARRVPALCQQHRVDEHVDLGPLVAGEDLGQLNRRCPAADSASARRPAARNSCARLYACSTPAAYTMPGVESKRSR